VSATLYVPAGTTVELIDRAPAPDPDPPPTVGGPLVWTKLNTSYTAGTEAEYQSWYNLVRDTKRDVIYGMNWMCVMAAFDPVAGRWNKLTPNIGGGVHNRAFGYDPINDLVWIGAGTYTGDRLVGINSFNPATNAFVQHTTAELFGMQSAIHYDAANRRFVIFGGWLQNGNLSARSWSIDPPAASTVIATNAGTHPPYGANDGTKMTMQRSGVDKRGRIFYVHDDGAVWLIPLDLSGPWQRVAIPGVVPHRYTQYAYHEGRDGIIGWSASSMVAGGAPNTTPTQQTWFLPFADMAGGWQLHANAAAGDVVPPITVYVGYSLCADPARGRVLLHTLRSSGNYDPETWVVA
jgi:hypothetical protein